MATFEEVCIIDDDELFLFLTKHIMVDENFADRIHDFDDGRKALDYIASNVENKLPEVLFLDINMPMMDGWEVMEAIEKLKIGDRMKIYITSSSINPSDLKKAEDNPFVQGFVSKPLNPVKLKSIAED